jgi:hypothetical protein
VNYTMIYGSTNIKLCARVAGGYCPTDLTRRAYLLFLTFLHKNKSVFSELNTVGFARTNVIVSRTLFVIASVRSSIH